jgi:hypothetical protein
VWRIDQAVDGCPRGELVPGGLPPLYLIEHIRAVGALGKIAGECESSGIVVLVEPYKLLYLFFFHRLQKYLKYSEIIDFIDIF